MRFQMQLQLTFRALRWLGIYVRQPVTAVWLCFVVDVLFCCLAIFVEQGLWLKKELLLRLLTVCPAIAKPLVGRSNSFSSFLSACENIFTAINYNLSVVVYIFAAIIV